jgi:nitrogen fixation NifU-like protein
MSDLRELYQQVILDHNKSPRNFRAIEGAHREARGHNPLCGDKLTVYVKLEDDRIADVSFEGTGCAISTASASLMTQALKGKTLAEAKALYEEFHDMVTGEPGGHAPSDNLGKLAVFMGVCEFPVRVKCATLCWHTLNNALEGDDVTATTE